MSKVQGNFPIDLKFVDERVYMNFWDNAKGNDICCRIVNGKIMKFINSPDEILDDELRDVPQIKDHFETVEISLSEFIELVKNSILNQSTNQS